MIEIDPQQAELLLKQNTLNIAKKLQKGQTLSARERDALQAVADGKGSLKDKPKWASNSILLAKELGITRETLAPIILKAKDAAKRGEKTPTRHENGMYLIHEWRDYAAANLKRGIPAAASDHSGKADSGDGFATRKERMMIEKLQLEIDNEKRKQAIDDRQYIKKDIAADEVRRCNEQVRNELMRRFKILAPSEYSQVQGDSNECREINERHLSEIFEYLHSGNWPE